MDSYTTYQQILELDPISLITFLESKKINVDGNITSVAAAEKASEALNIISNNYSYISTLFSIAKVAKRNLSRTGLIYEYEDMIDKVAAIDNTLKAIDIQYRALSKSISLYMENHKEYYNPACN